MYQRAVKIVQARIGIVSNNEKLITEPRYFEGHDLGVPAHRYSLD